jgi:hypothetical protein
LAETEVTYSRSSDSEVDEGVTLPADDEVGGEKTEKERKEEKLKEKMYALFRRWDT